MARNAGDDTVLVVGRDSTAATALADLLSDAGWTIRTETTAATAAEAVVEDRPDCVVSGHDGDDLDGLALLERVRAVASDLPFVLYPSAGDEATASAAVAAGVTDYVPRDPEGGRGGEDALIDGVAAILDGDSPATGGDGSRERLEFRESLLSAQQEATPAGLLVADEDGRIVSHNDRFRKLWRLTEAVLEGGCAAVLAEIEADVADPADAPETLRDAGEDRSGRIELRLEDGRTVEGYTQPVLSDDGRRFGRLWEFRDVTDRRAQRRELERKHRAIAEAPIGIVVTGEDGDDNPILYANERFASLTGYDATGIEGRDCRFLQGADTDPAPVAELRRAVDEERSTTVELRNYRKDGAEFWNRVTVAPIAGEDGSVDHFVGFQEDVSDRKRRVQDLEESERRFHAVFEDPNILVALLDPDGTVIDVNRTAMEYVPVDRSAVIGQSFPETPWFAGDGSVAAEARSLIERAAAGEYAAFEFDHSEAVGDTLVVTGEFRPVTDADGEVVSLIVSAREITERRRRDRQLDALDRVLRHNLHNEMNVILGNAESILDRSEGELAERAATIVNSGRNLLDVTTKQRRIVRLLSEAPDRTSIPLSNTLEDCAAALRERYPNADLSVDVPDGVAVRAIPQIGTALRELTENAIVHAAAPEPTVRVAVEATDETVRIGVSDRGPGIPEEELSILLGEGERGPLYHGNGMGLWLVDWIVSYSEGTVEYAENDPQGSVVTVSFPRADAT